MELLGTRVITFNEVRSTEKFHYYSECYSITYYPNVMPYVYLMRSKQI